MVQVKKLETRPRRCRGRTWTWANTLRIIFYNVRGDGPHVEGGKVLRTNAHAGGKLFGLIGYLLLLLGMISWMIGAGHTYEYIQDNTGAGFNSLFVYHSVFQHYYSYHPSRCMLLGAF